MSQYDRPTDAAVEIARRRLDGTLDRVKDQLNVSPTRRVLPASVLEASIRTPSPTDETKDMSNTASPVVITTTITPGTGAVTTTTAPGDEDYWGFPYGGHAHSRRTLTAPLSPAPAEVVDRQLDRLQVQTLENGKRKVYYDAVQQHLDAEIAALQASPLPQQRRPRTAPSRFSSDPPPPAAKWRTEDPAPTKNTWIDTYRWVPPSPPKKTFDKQTQHTHTMHNHRHSDSLYKPKITRSRTVDPSAVRTLRSADYAPEWSKGLSLPVSRQPRRWNGDAHIKHTQVPSTAIQQSRNNAGQHRLENYVGRDAQRTYSTNDAGTTFITRDVRDVLHGRAQQPYKWHPRDVRDDLFLCKGNDAERAVLYDPPPSEDESQIREMTAKAMDKVVGQVVKRILAK